MKTTVKTVTVEVTDNGRPKHLVYTIATKDGTLMTHRLERLLAGKLGRGYGRYDDHGIGLDMCDVHFVGMIWKPPYQLLREIIHDHVELQRELNKLEGSCFVTVINTVAVPDKASNDYISRLILRELDERRAIKAAIRRLDAIKDAQNARMAREQDDDSWKPILPPMRTPYSW